MAGRLRDGRRRGRLDGYEDKYIVNADTTDTQPTDKHHSSNASFRARLDLLDPSPPASFASRFALAFVLI